MEAILSLNEMAMLILQNTYTGYCGCNICGSYSEHKPFGNRRNRRRYAKCPDCGSLERHRFLWAKLIQLDLLRGQVLHIEPSKCLHKAMHKHSVGGKYKYASTTYGIYHHYAELHGIDIQDMSHIGDKAYDLVICSHVLEHVDNHAQALRELVRIGKTVVIMVPFFGEKSYQDARAICNKTRLKYHFHKEHMRVYGSADFMPWLKANMPCDTIILEHKSHNKLDDRLYIINTGSNA